jgi:hypothetical protein
MCTLIHGPAIVVGIGVSIRIRCNSGHETNIVLSTESMQDYWSMKNITPMGVSPMALFNLFRNEFVARACKDHCHAAI